MSSGAHQARRGDLPGRADSPLLAAALCPILVLLLLPSILQVWQWATEAAQKNGMLLIAPRWGKSNFNSASRDLFNALFAGFVVLGAVLMALGLCGLALPGHPYMPLDVMGSVLLLLVTSLCGWQLGEVLTRRKFARSYGRQTRDICRCLMIHSALSWVIFIIAMIGEYR